MTVTPSSRAAPLATRAPRSGEPEELALLADEMQATGRALDALVAACPPERAPALAAAALLCGPRAGDELLEAVWEGLDARVALAGASRLATRLPAERALRWSARLRESGLGAHCPLVAAARDLGSPPSERARRAAVAWRAFGDPGARTLALDAASEIESTTVRASLREELDAIAPDVASVLHETARTSPGVTSGPPGGGAGRGTRVRVLLGVDHDSRATCEARWREVLDERADELLAADGGPDGRGARTAAAVHSPRVAGDAEEILVLVDGTLHPAAGWRAALVRLFALRRDVAFAAAVVSARAPAGERAATVGMELLLDARYEPTLVARPCPVEEAPGHGLGSVESQACAPGG
ncbi:MAG: hypothetical protein M0Z33_08300, partial [Actinomycetota bacterium]|nr:hypothetical protein [Actinomycetota bacterium]